MAPSSICYDGQYRASDGNCYSRSNFYYWGRWVLAAIVIVFFIALFAAWSCISNRRRRRAGMNPRYGTGWMGGYSGYPPTGQQQHPAPQYSNGGWFGAHNKNNNPPPPQYTPSAVPNQTTGTTFNTADGYYGHQGDVPLQPPAGSYYPRGGEPVYEPPSGPPPAKN